MRGKSWAFLGISIVFAAAALAEETSPSDNSSPIALTEAPLLDPGASDTASDAAPAPPTATEVPPPVLDQPSLEDLTASLSAKPTERKWRIIPFGRLKISTDDNLFISATNRQSDVEFNISPGLAFGWGDYGAEIKQLGDFDHYFKPLSLELTDTPQSFLFAKYVANQSLFVDHSDQDALDHDALLDGRWAGKRLELDMRLEYQTLSGADLDVGDRTKRKVFDAGLSGSYQLTEKTSIQLSLSDTSYNYETALDWSQWMLEDFLSYQILPKTQIAIGSRLGIMDVSTEAKQKSEQAVARISFNASSKLAVEMDGGVEWRQFDSGAPSNNFAVFNFSATYAPFDGTSFEANAYRRNIASVSELDNNILETGISARVRQRLFHRFYFSIDGGYQNSEYQANSTPTTAGRQDKTVYVRPRLSFDITKFLSAESSYQYQKNDSKDSDTSFTENIVSFQINLQF